MFLHLPLLWDQPAAGTQNLLLGRSPDSKLLTVRYHLAVSGIWLDWIAISDACSVQFRMPRKTNLGASFRTFSNVWLVLVLRSAAKSSQTFSSGRSRPRPRTPLSLLKVEPDLDQVVVVRVLALSVETSMMIRLAKSNPLQQLRGHRYYTRPRPRTLLLTALRPRTSPRTLAVASIKDKCHHSRNAKLGGALAS
jgi:hypothetical protein